jgi:hypothetical protein
MEWIFWNVNIIRSEFEMNRKIIALMLLTLLLSACGQKDDVSSENLIEENCTEEISQSEYRQPNIESIYEQNSESVGLELEDPVMEGMLFLSKSLVEAGGFGMRLNGQEGLGSKFIILGQDNELKVVVESGGPRKMAVQILIDYVQVPIIVDGESYYSYYIETDGNISLTKIIKLDTDIDMSVNHKITALLLNDLQLSAGEIDDETKRFTMNGGGVTLDRLLVCDTDKGKLAECEAQYETEMTEYDDEYGTVILTTDDSGNRKLVKENINVSPGEKIKLYYHIGGFTESGESVMWVNVGEKQTKINGKDFLLFKGEPGKVLYGEIEFTAPTESGKYEIGVWKVNNPYGEIENIIQIAMGGPRITLNVE